MFVKFLSVLGLFSRAKLDRSSWHLHFVKSFWRFDLTESRSQTYLSSLTRFLSKSQGLNLTEFSLQEDLSSHSDFNLTERFTPGMFVKSISTSELISGTKLDRIPSAGRFVKSFWRFDLTESRSQTYLSSLTRFLSKSQGLNLTEFSLQEDLSSHSDFNLTERFTPGMFVKSFRIST